MNTQTTSNLHIPATENLHILVPESTTDLHTCPVPESILETLTITHAKMLHELIDSVDSYDLKHEDLHNTFNIRAAKLIVLREAGITDVQSGTNFNSNNPVVLPNQLSYKIVKEEYNARFLLSNPDASEDQIKANLAQQIQSLKYWVLTGNFCANIGRDRPRKEIFLAQAASIKAQFVSFHAAKAAKTALNASNVAEKHLKIQQDAIIQLKKVALVAKTDEEIKSANDRLIKLEEEAGKAQIKANEEAKEAKRLKIAADVAKEAREKAEKLEFERRAALQAKKQKSIPTTTLKVQSEETKISPKAGISEECRLEAAQLLAELEENQAPTSVLIELARLIINKYQASK